MKYGKHWEISNEQKQEYIDRLLPQLSSLRAKAGLSQDELSSLVGISRQTYCLTESGARGMSWNTYLSIIMFFDYNVKTHELIRSTGVYPEKLFSYFNPGNDSEDEDESVFSAPMLNEMFGMLGSTGKNMVRLSIACEYARQENLGREKSIDLIRSVMNS